MLIVVAINYPASKGQAKTNERPYIWLSSRSSPCQLVNLKAIVAFTFNYKPDVKLFLFIVNWKKIQSKKERGKTGHAKGGRVRLSVPFGHLPVVSGWKQLQAVFKRLLFRFLQVLCGHNLLIIIPRRLANISKGIEGSLASARGGTLVLGASQLQLINSSFGTLGHQCKWYNAHTGHSAYRSTSFPLWGQFSSSST